MHNEALVNEALEDLADFLLCKLQLHLLHLGLVHLVHGQCLNRFAKEGAPPVETRSPALSGHFSERAERRFHQHSRIVGQRNLGERKLREQCLAPPTKGRVLRQLLVHKLDLHLVLGEMDPLAGLLLPGSHQAPQLELLSV